MTTDELLDWCKATATATGLVTAENVTDERERSLDWLINTALMNSFGTVVLFSLPSKTRDTANTGETMYRVSIGCAIHSSILAQNSAQTPANGSETGGTGTDPTPEPLKPYEVADRMFAAFNNASCYPEGSYARIRGKQNTSTDQLTHSKWDDTKETHMFRIEILTTLH